MTTLTSTDFSRPAADGSASYSTVNLDVTFKLRVPGAPDAGYWVARRDNGRHLGWVTTGTFADGKPCWIARISETAFRGAGPDDLGHVLDTVPNYLSRCSNGGTDPCGYGRTRPEAAEELLYELLQRHAPAVGYGPHPYVRRWADR